MTHSWLGLYILCIYCKTTSPPYYYIKKCRNALSSLSATSILLDNWRKWQTQPLFPHWHNAKNYNFLLYLPQYKHMLIVFAHSEWSSTVQFSITYRGHTVSYDPHLRSFFNSLAIKLIHRAIIPQCFHSAEWKMRLCTYQPIIYSASSCTTHTVICP